MNRMRIGIGLLALCSVMLGIGSTSALAAPKSNSMLDTIKNGLVLPKTRAWKAGQQATHRLTWDAGKKGTLTLDVRFALTGEENGNFWYEWNFTNPGGTMGKDIAPYVGGLTLRFLTVQTDETSLKKMINGIQQKSADSISDSVHKFQFQITGQPLYEVSFQDLAKQTTDIVLSETGTTDAEVTVPEPAGSFDWETGRETVQVPAGTFNNSLFWQADFTDPEAAGNVHINMHENIPLIPVAKIVANVSGSSVGGANQVRLELISSAETGARTLSTGQPIQKTADAVIGELFMLLMTGGTSGTVTLQ